MLYYSLEIRPLSTELFREDTPMDRKTDRQMERQTDMIKLIVVICNFANAPKMCRFCTCN